MHARYETRSRIRAHRHRSAKRNRWTAKEGVTQVVVVGVATSIGVESTARFAYELGFNVTLAVDAMTDMNADAHDNSVARIFPRLGETGTTAEIVALLDGAKRGS